MSAPEELLSIGGEAGGPRWSQHIGENARHTGSVWRMLVRSAAGPLDVTYALTYQSS
jgi:hypothetical protein